MVSNFGRIKLFGEGDREPQKHAITGADIGAIFGNQIALLARAA